MRDVAASADLSLGAAYYYFETKEALVAAYYDYVQTEHQERAAAAFREASSLRARLGVAFHTKLDILRKDRKLLTALFRYGGDRDHPLAWFGPATRRQRELSSAVFEEALGDDSLPADMREVAPLLLWTLHLGILLYFLYDRSPGQRKTRKLMDGALDLFVQALRVARFPLMMPVRRRVIALLREADLLPEARVS